MNRGGVYAARSVTFSRESRASIESRRPLPPWAPVTDTSGTMRTFFFRERLGQLHQRVVWGAERPDAGAVGLGLGVAGGADGLGLARGAELGGLGLAARALDGRLRVEVGDAHALVGVDHLLLDVRERGGAHEFLTLALRGLLDFVGLLFLLGDFAVGLGFHQLDRRCDVADQRVDRLHIVRGEGGADVRGGLGLPRAAGVEEIEHRVVLGGVAEIVSDDRLQRVVDEVLHRADARDYLGGVEGADVDDLCDVEVEREAVLRTHRDGAELFVEVVRLGPVGPVEDDVGRRHEFDPHDARVDRMLAGVERGDPHALVTDVDEVAVLEFGAAHVEVRKADKGDHDADGPDRDVQHRDLFQLGEPRVEVPRAGEQDLLLQTAAAAPVEEGLGVLEVVVAGNGRAGDLARLDRPTVEGGDDADLVGTDVSQFERGRRDVVFRGIGGGDDLEERAVDPVGAGGEQGELPALFAAAGEKAARILKIITVDHAAQDAARRDRGAGGGDDEGDLARGDVDHRRLHDAELPEPAAEVEAGRQGVGLVTGLAVERDQLAGGQGSAGEFLDDNADLIFADEHEAEQGRSENQAGEEQRAAFGPPVGETEGGEGQGERRAAQGQADEGGAALQGGAGRNEGKRKE